ncbi:MULTISPECIES: type II toxin-antitoxin system HicA family toxin [Caproicibacterium]|uniref:Type II toxin-antitoxin system HicA family toxin n=1 Tax=Caproicibacterium argilliputei TaxID=3030016 RepID=A0AA97H2I3_9FIRM|nr:type II toxin-antitoxin system HicA family toxin [Caproicibacterium argilliputei]WOC33658.1 type II toxin-antitoxin system HicA family toxin [Caproicibacterium argilliputei]
MKTKSDSSRELIKLITADGWYEVRCVGDHHQFKHPTKPGLVTITHPRKDIPIKTARSIAAQAGITLP